MNRLFAMAGVAAALVLCGCENQPPDTSDANAVPTTQQLLDQQVLVNSTKLSTVPLPVRAAYQHDFPSLGISSVQNMTTSTGRPLYRITFLNAGGVPDSVTYDVNGQIVQAPQTVSPMPPSMRVPLAPARPQPQPAP